MVGHLPAQRMLQHLSSYQWLPALSLLHWQRVEEEALAREQSRQRALDAERERVAEMQRRQREQEQFSAFEEMIRRQELEKERQRVLLEFAKPATPSPDAPLIPGIQAPSLVSPSAPQSPGDLSSGVNHQYNRPPQNSGPPNFDRSLKPGSLFSPGNNSEFICLWYRGLAFRGFKHCPAPVLKYLYVGADFFPPDLLYYLLTPCRILKHYKNPTLLSAFLNSFFPPRYNGGCPSAAVRALWAMQELSEVGWGQHQPGGRNVRHFVWQTGKILQHCSSSEPGPYTFSPQLLSGLVL